LKENDRINQNLSWNYPLSISPYIVNQLIFPRKGLIYGLSEFHRDAHYNYKNLEEIDSISRKIKSHFYSGLKIIPIKIPSGGYSKGVINDISKIVGVSVVEYIGDSNLLLDFVFLRSILSYSWLRNHSIYFNPNTTQILKNNDNFLLKQLISLKEIPITIFLGFTNDEIIKNIPANLSFPTITIPKSTFEDRLKEWKKYLISDDDKTNEIIHECARNFRFEGRIIKEICNCLNECLQPLSKEKIFRACRVEVNLENIDFIQKITPRFQNERLILPYKQHLQFKEIKVAMNALTRVYYEWGLAESWNECGLSVLFTGAPGTGKTMAAEILSRDLNLPLYKIDLSQVINKYIGETEKNLKKVFEFAEVSDVILFFDEADALFGQRTEIKDAHDRYANITVSYLLERMENFNGLAILATNREVNLDEAFIRRFRYILNFPMPEYDERFAIWNQVLPKGIKASNIDIEFLAKKFPISGGNIRSIMLNACLQSVGSNQNSSNELKMKELVIALKREYDKIHQPISLAQFGQYAKIIQNLEVFKSG